MGRRSHRPSGSIRAALAMALLASGCATPISEPTLGISVTGISSNRLEIPVSYNESVVRVSTTNLRPGDYYGSIQIKSDIAGRATVNVPVHAAIYGSAAGSGSTMLSPRAPGEVTCSRPIQTPHRQTTGGAVRWVKPPPARAEAGVVYPVSFYGWIKQGDDGYIAARVDASDTENLLGDAPINFEAGDYRSLSDPIEGTLRFDTCAAQTVFVYLRWYINNERNQSLPVRVEVSPPSGPRAILSPNEMGATAVEGPNPGPIGSLSIRSLCDLSMRWKILNKASWLDISPSEGVGSQSVSLTPTAAILAPGEYRATPIVAVAEGGPSSVASVRFIVSPVRLQWDPTPPSTIGAGEEILAAVRGVPGFKPYYARLWFEEMGTSGTSYGSDAIAIPRLDGAFVAPLRISDCSGGQYRVRAETYGPSGKGEVTPALIEVRPAEGAIVNVYPSTLRFSGTETAVEDSKELTISLSCGNDFGLATITASQPWILLEDESNERQDYN